MCVTTSCGLMPRRLTPPELSLARLLTYNRSCGQPKNVRTSIPEDDLFAGIPADSDDNE